MNGCFCGSYSRVGVHAYSCPAGEAEPCECDECARDRDATPRKAAGFEAEGSQPGPSGIAETLSHSQVS